jgi:hypothetical protein
LTRRSNGSGVALGEARNRCAQRLIFAARAHCQLILIRDYRAFLLARAAESEHAALLPVLTKLFVVLALFLVERHMGDFQTSGCVEPRVALAMGEALDALLRELRPDAVAIADAFDHSDYNLDSALGRRDGDVYRDLFDRVKVRSSFLLFAHFFCLLIYFCRPRAGRSHQPHRPAPGIRIHAQTCPRRRHLGALVQTVIRAATS